MALYSYQAVSREGKTIRGTINASSAKAARDQLSNQNLYPIKIVLQEEQRSLLTLLTGFFGARVGLDQKIFFTRQLAVLLHAGIPLVDALSLMEQQTSGRLKGIVVTLRDDVTQGISFTDALAKHPRVFESLYIQLVKAGEASGTLETVLDRISQYLERQAELRKRVRSALSYPITQLFMIAGVTGFLVSFVIPQIAGIFKGREQLPLVTRALLALSDFLRGYYLYVFGGIVLFFIVYRYWKMTPSGSRMIDKVKLKIPIVKYFVRMQAVVQFSRTLGLLLQNGVNLSDSLDIVCSIVDNRILVDILNEARERIIKQGRVAEYLKKTDLFPPVAIYMINTGEQSGELDTMLLEVADQYDMQLKDFADNLTAKISPIMLVIMGVVTVAIILSIMLPMTQIVQL